MYRKNISLFILTGKSQDVYWIATQELGRPVEEEDRVRYTENDIQELCAELADATIVPGVQFKDISQRRREARMVPLEEGISETWYAKRMFLLGDSCHKVSIISTLFDVYPASFSWIKSANILTDGPSRSTGR